METRRSILAAPRSRLFLVGLIALAVVRLVAAGPLSRPHLRFLQSDGPSYLYLAEALVSGRGYTDIHLAEPAPHTRIAPGLSLLIAPFVAAGTGLRAIKLTLNLFAFASGFAFLVGLRRLGFSLGVALLATALFLLAPLGLGQSDDLLPQPPEGLAFAVALVLIVGKDHGREDRGQEGGETNQRIRTSKEFFGRAQESAPTIKAAIAGCLLAACIMLRMADLALWAGSVLFLMTTAGPLRRRLANAAAVSTAPALATGAWLIRNLVRGSAMGTDYLGVWLGRDPSLETEAAVGPMELAMRVGHNALTYLEHASRLVLPDGVGGHPAAGWALGAAAVGLAAWGARKTAGPAARSLWCFGGPLLAECLLWPFPFIHYFYPLYPLLYAALAAGALAAAGLAAERLKLPSDERVRVSAAVVGAAVWLGLSLLPWLDYQPRTVQLREGFSLRFDSPGAEAVYGLARAAAADMSGCGSCRLLTHSPMHVALITGPVYDLPMLPPGQQLDYLEAHRITHLLVDPVFPRTGAYLVPLVQARPERFEKIDRLTPAPYGVYRFRPAASQPG